MEHSGVVLVVGSTPIRQKTFSRNLTRQLAGEGLESICGYLCPCIQTLNCCTVDVVMAIA